MKVFSGFKQRRNKRSKKTETEVDYSLPYEGTEGKSISRSAADKMYNSKVTSEERGLGSTLTQDSEGNYTRRTKLSSPAKQTSHGPIREYQIPEDPNNFPRIHRAKKHSNTTGPGKGPDDGPHPKRKNK